MLEVHLSWANGGREEGDSKLWYLKLLEFRRSNKNRKKLPPWGCIFLWETTQSTGLETKKDCTYWLRTWFSGYGIEFVKLFCLCLKMRDSRSTNHYPSPRGPPYCCCDQNLPPSSRSWRPGPAPDESSKIRLDHPKWPCGNGNHTTYKNGDDWVMVYYYMSTKMWFMTLLHLL